MVKLNQYQHVTKRGSVKRNPKRRFFTKTGEIIRRGWIETLMKTVMDREGLKTRDEFFTHHNYGYLGDMPDLVVKYNIHVPKSELKKMREFYFTKNKDPANRVYWEKVLPEKFRRMLEA